MTTKAQFLFPISILKGENFQLEPFDTTKHATPYFEVAKNAPELYTYMNIGPFHTEQEFLTDVVDAAEANPTSQLYAIMTTRKPKTGNPPSSTEPALAGLVAFMATSEVHLRTEIGPIVLLPQYQGIGLAPGVVELMVQHAFKPLTGGGWGIRRVCWMANTANVASIKLAERLGFKSEGLVRWQMVLRNGVIRGKIGNGRKLPPGAEEGDVGRDDVILSRCWDD